MQINARVITGSHIDSNWRNKSLNSGEVCGVRFKLWHDQFIANDVPPGALDHLLNHSSVIVEFVTEPVGQVVAVGTTEPDL